MEKLERGGCENQSHSWMQTKRSIQVKRAQTSKFIQATPRFRCRDLANMHARMGNYLAYLNTRGVYIQDPYLCTHIAQHPELNSVVQ